MGKDRCLLGPTPVRTFIPGFEQTSLQKPNLRVKNFPVASSPPCSFRRGQDPLPLGASCRPSALGLAAFSECLRRLDQMQGHLAERS